MPKKVAKKFSPEQVFIGIDYGDRTLGVAMGRGGFVTPLSTVNATDLNTAFVELTRYAISNKADIFVVGLPLDARGKETKSSLKVRAFANRLKAFSKKQVLFQNEFATSLDAQGEMIDMEISQKRRRTDDHYAAAIILKNFFSDNGFE